MPTTQLVQSDWCCFNCFLLHRKLLHEKYTQWGRLWDHPHEQDSTCELPLSKLISFSPTCSLLLPWQASPTGNIGSDAANPVVSTPHRLRSSEISKTLSVSLVVMPPRHHQPALPSLISELRQKRYWLWQRKLAQLLYLGVSPFCTRSRGLVLNLKVPPTEWNSLAVDMLEAPFVRIFFFDLRSRWFFCAGLFLSKAFSNKNLCPPFPNRPARLSPFLRCSSHTRVPLCACLLICAWKRVIELININKCKQNRHDVLCNMTPVARLFNRGRRSNDFSEKNFRLGETKFKSRLYMYRGVDS